MKNQSLWKPTRIHKDGKGRISFSRKEVYPGSWHIAALQVKAYTPLLEKYAGGRLLDCGCGQLPWYEVYQKNVEYVYAIDWSDDPKVTAFIDEKADLSQKFALQESAFDTVLLSDVLAHISNPENLMAAISSHLKTGGHLILTTPFVYWISEYPDEYYHMTDTALKALCARHQFEILHLESYGGYGDVLLDTLNKGMTSRFSHRVFRMLASVVIKTRWYKKVNLKTRYSYPLGYTLVARKQ